MNIRDHRLQIAYQYAIGSYGEREYEGIKNNPNISRYMNATWYGLNDDSVPWCSAFVNWCMLNANIDRTESPRAKSWLEWGEETNQPVAGDIVVLTRSGGGHVGFYVSGGRGRIALLGGNQSDSVCISDYEASRVIGIRTIFERLETNPTNKPEDKVYTLPSIPQVNVQEV